VILCERGIRTFETIIRATTMDISAIPVVKQLSHLPIGAILRMVRGRRIRCRRWRARGGGGGDAVVESTRIPNARSAMARRALFPEQFEELMDNSGGSAPAVGRTILAMRHVVVIGTGLIGASFGLALRKNGFHRHDHGGVFRAGHR